MNHLYEETEETIQGPINGQMTFLRRLKILRVQPIQDNHQVKLPHRRKALPRIICVAGPRLLQALQEAPPKQSRAKKHYDPDFQWRPLGKIVSGPHGEYYESIEGGLRPLGKVVANQDGQFFELVKRPPIRHGTERADGGCTTPPSETPGRSNKSKAHSRTQDLRAKPYGLVYEKMFPDPGSYIRIPFADFEVELTDQIASPKLLKPESLLDCMLQIYQIHRSIPVERLALVELGDSAQAVQIHPLTEKKALALGVTIRPTKRKAAANKQQALLALPGQYFFQLSLLFDPTLKEENVQFGDSQQNGYESGENGHIGVDKSIME